MTTLPTLDATLHAMDGLVESARRTTRITDVTRDPRGLIRDTTTREVPAVKAPDFLRAADELLDRLVGTRPNDAQWAQVQGFLAIRNGVAEAIRAGVPGETHRL